MKKSLTNNSRLYVTKDMWNENTWFARSQIEQFARFKRTEFGWQIWLYPFKVLRYKRTLTESLDFINKSFKKYWSEKYGKNELI